MGRLNLIIGLGGAAIVIIMVLLYVFSGQEDDDTLPYTLPAGAGVGAGAGGSAPPASSYPAGLVEGNVVGAHNIGIWLLTSGGTRRHYTPAGYEAAGKPAYTMISPEQMNAIPVGGPPI